MLYITVLSSEDRAITATNNVTEETVKELTEAYIESGITIYR